MALFSSIEGSKALNKKLQKLATETGKIPGTELCSQQVDGRTSVEVPRWQLLYPGAPGELGEVAHREFLGAQIRYLVRVGDAELIVDCSHQRGAAGLSIGEAIDLTVSMDQAVVFHA